MPCDGQGDGHPSRLHPPPSAQGEGRVWPLEAGEGRPEAEEESPSCPWRTVLWGQGPPISPGSHGAWGQVRWDLVKLQKATKSPPVDKGLRYPHWPLVSSPAGTAHPCRSGLRPRSLWAATSPVPHTVHRDPLETGEEPPQEGGLRAASFWGVFRSQALLPLWLGVEFLGGPGGQALGPRFLPQRSLSSPGLSTPLLGQDRENCGFP